MTRSIRVAIGLALATTSIPVLAQQRPDQVQARQIYEKVITFRTSQGQGQVPPMVAYLEGVLRDAGISADNIVKLPKAETVGMLVRVPGSYRNAKPILFSAHMDVVDARPEDWKRDPYKLIEENGYFYGRGTIDNKGGVVALMSTILRMQKAGVKPKRTLVFAFIGDEETGLDETDGTTRQVAAHPWVKGAEFAINTDAGGGLLAPDGKPMIYLVQGAEKTYATFELTATNKGGHSSRPRTDNAIYEIARAVTRIDEYRFPAMSNDLTRSYLGAVGKVTPGPAGEMLKRFAANPEDSAAADAIAGIPEFVGTTRTTCVATMLSGGHAENALPQKATATVNCRIFPGVSIDDVQKKLTTQVADPKISVKVLGAPFASPVSELRPDIERAITQSIHKRYPGVAVTPYLESGGTDGMVYRTAGIPTWATSGIFIKPEEMFAHGLDERVPVKSFYDGLDHIHDLAVALGGD
ncbi:M20/M25/M40 family metallo-hydrolase [Sphingomonas sp. NSE70-1]|uniref:M20/M25/M40 family metallo-hydrolase n=1 Tax=Sphingomonas caseinilyticus TaxID=2908205 RepID=A0ABT0RX53_9SPHN|nr:M20/M25/M40 family metallo-hydrolase [Sphingomonas caseinilyticus]MCL6699612.1 M20/M25/M40 family metallo-hydrolase [Sphingomonas caseinilyticus]